MVFSVVLEGGDESGSMVCRLVLFKEVDNAGPLRKLILAGQVEASLIKPQMVSHDADADAAADDADADDDAVCTSGQEIICIYVLIIVIGMVIMEICTMGLEMILTCVFLIVSGGVGIMIE